MKKLKHIFFWTMSVLAAAGCARVEVRPDVPTADIPILFRGRPETKAIFDADNFQTAGNAVKVNDKFEYNGSTVMYFDNLTAKCNGSTMWDYGTPKYWSADGIHYFTAYTSVNATEDSPVNLPGTQAAYNSADRSIIVAPWTLTLDNQFDFCYGSHTRDLTRDPRDYSPVNLQLKHLFAAVCFRVFNQTVNSNDDNNYFSIDEFRLKNVYDSGSATIAYDTDAVYGTLSRSGNNFEVKPGARLGYNVPYPVYAGQGSGVGSDGCLLFWPHDFEKYSGIEVEISCTSKNTVSDEKTSTSNRDDYDNRSKNPHTAPVTEGRTETTSGNTTTITVISNLKEESELKYEFPSLVRYYWWSWTETVTTITPVTTTDRIDKTIKFSDMTTGSTQWQAGYKYLYNIYIKDDHISFTLEVIPWENDDVILEE